MKLTNSYACAQLNAPELKKHKKFCAWLSRASGSRPSNEPRAATWHRGGEKLGEFSDLFVWKDRNHEGSDTDMPEDVWNTICDTVGENFCGVIWITFY